MNSDPIRGRTIRFTFSDGPMAKKTFEHVFETRGTVTFRGIGDGASPSAGKNANGDGVKVSGPKYEIAMVREDVGAVSYLERGYTLTTLLDFKSKKLVAFASNEKGVSAQHGTFEYGEAAPARS